MKVFTLANACRFVPFKQVTTSVYLGPCTLVSGFACHILHCKLGGIEFISLALSYNVAFCDPFPLPNCRCILLQTLRSWPVSNFYY